MDAQSMPPMVDNGMHGEANPSKRKRVTRACDACKRAKCKCDGVNPCHRCMQLNQACQFNMPYTRGKLIHPMPRGNLSAFAGPGNPIASANNPYGMAMQAQGSYDYSQTTPQSLQMGYAPHTPTLMGRPQPDGLGMNRMGGPPSSYDPALVHAGGRSDPTMGFDTAYRQVSNQEYFGGLVALKMLERLRNSLLSKRTPDERRADVLREVAQSDEKNGQKSEHFQMPSFEEMQVAINNYFDYVMPTYRSLIYHVVLGWLTNHFKVEEDVLVTDTSTQIVLLMLYALGTVFVPSEDIETQMNDRAKADACFDQAVKLRSTLPSSKATLMECQGSFLICLYLAHDSCFSGLWYELGHLSRQILALGLHRYSSSRKSSNIESQQRRRLFWCAHALDRYVSAIMGRPFAINEEDVDALLPAAIDDEQIKDDVDLSMIPSDPTCPMAAATQLNRLSRMLGEITKHSFGPLTLTQNPEYRAHRTNDLKTQLETFAGQLPNHLNLRHPTLTSLAPDHFRQTAAMRMSYWHCMLNLHRNCLYLRPGVKAPNNQTIEINQAVFSAHNAAMSLKQLFDDKGLNSAYGFSSYMAFSSSVAMLIVLYQFMQPSNPGYESLKSSIEDSVRILHQVKASNDMNERYLLALNEIVAIMVDADMGTRAPWIAESSDTEDINIDWDWLEEQGNTSQNVSIPVTLLEGLALNTIDLEELEMHSP